MKGGICVSGLGRVDDASVLLVAESGRSGGIGRYCVDLGTILGPAATLVCLCPDPCDDTAGCWLARQCRARGLRLVSVPMPNKAWSQGLRGLTSAWREEGKPIVHVNGRRGNFIASLAGSWHRDLFFVTTVHGVLGLHDRRNLAYRVVDRGASGAASRVIAVSSDTKRRLITAGVPWRKVVTIRNALASPDIERLGALADRRVRPDGSGRLRVGFLGRLSPEKGIDDFQRATRFLAARSPQVEFLVAGDGPSLTRFEEQTAALRGEGRLRCLGDVDGPEQFLTDTDVLVMPSHNEGLPYVLLEGMAAGCAIVAYGVGGIPEVVSDRSLGRLVRPGDFDGLLSTISEFVRDPSAAWALGVRASAHVREKFQLATRLPALIATYESCGLPGVRSFAETRVQPRGTV